MRFPSDCFLLNKPVVYIKQPSPNISFLSIVQIAFTHREFGSVSLAMHASVCMRISLNRVLNNCMYTSDCFCEIDIFDRHIGVIRSGLQHSRLAMLLSFNRIQRG